MTDPTVVEASMLRRAVAYAASRGADIPHVLALARVDEAEVAASELLVPLSRALELYAAIADTLDDPAFGLHLAAASDATDYGLIGLLFTHHPTADAGVDAIAHYYSAFLASAEVKVTRDAGRTRISSKFAHEHPGLTYLRQEMITSIYLQTQRASGSSWKPLAVTFREQPQDPTPFVEVFGVTPTFGAPEDTLSLDPTPLRAPNLGADAVLLNHLLEAAETHLARRRAAAGTASRVLLLRGCSADLTSGIIHRGRDTLTLTTKERELLVYLADHMNEIVTHEAIERDVWGIGRSVISHAPAVAIRRLRQKIEPVGPKPVNLVTVFGEGWKLVVPEST